MIGKPPESPKVFGMPRSLEDYLIRLHTWLGEIANTLQNIDLGKTKFSAGSSLPFAGQDGDVYIRVSGPATAIYLNINGRWSAYQNP